MHLETFKAEAQGMVGLLKYLFQRPNGNCV